MQQVAQRSGVRAVNVKEACERMQPGSRGDHGPAADWCECETLQALANSIRDEDAAIARHNSFSYTVTLPSGSVYPLSGRDTAAAIAAAIEAGKESQLDKERR